MTRRRQDRRREFLDLMFEQTRDLSAPFKHNTETYGDDAKYPKGVYEVECRGIEKPLIKRSFPYFRGFLSLKEGITRLDGIERRGGSRTADRLRQVDVDDAKI